MTVAAVIPAYNEARTIAGIVRATLPWVDRVFVVDDGSTDGTAATLHGLPVRVVRHERNAGKGASLWDGLRLARSKGAAAVVTLDGDGQHRPEDIPRLLAAAADHPGALIIAARLRHRERVPGARRFANAQADFWISWAAGCAIADSQSGFRLYPAALIDRLGPVAGRSTGFAFESEVLIAAARQDFRLVAVPVDALYPADTRPSHYRPWADTARIVGMVAGKLIARGMYPQGLLRSLRQAPQIAATGDAPPSAPG